MTQLVPLDTRVQVSPATAARIAVLAAPPTRGITLLEADTNV